MNSKVWISLFLIFGIFFTFAQCGRMTFRATDDDDDDDSSDDDGAVAVANDDDDSDEDEKRAIQDFLQNEDDASEFLDRSSRLFSDQKSQMKEAKKKYEEKCERLLHPRYCPDLATWPAWNQAFASATGKKK